MRAARVIGAGLSGLAAAWCLAEAGYDVEVIEASAEPGGLIRSFQAPEGLVERAANAFVWTSTTERWFRALDLSPLFPTPASRRRFIFRNGRPRRWPLTIGESAAMGARAASAWARGQLKPSEPESVETWSNRVLGAAATHWLVSPALGGLYAASASDLSAAAIVKRSKRAVAPRGKTASMAAPAGGMGEFATRLTDALIRRGVMCTFNRPVTSLDPSIPTIVGTDARAASKLVAPYAPKLAATIARIEMNILASATAFFPSHARDDHGFGVLFPRDAGVRALGVLFNSDVFAGRSVHRSETWIYGGTNAGSAVPSEVEMRSVIAHDREILTGRSHEPLAIYTTSPAPRLPVYGAAILEVERRLPELPGWLALSGNYLGRLGVARLLEVAEEAAARLTAPTASPYTGPAQGRC
jgi:oxygen-dependent protoporphyrinogen oxidase